MDESKREGAVAAMRQINQAWLDGRVEDLAPMVHAEIVMVFPNSPGRFKAVKTFLPASMTSAKTIQEFSEHDQQVDVAGDTAVISFRYEMVYVRSGERYRANGRDLWVFQQQDGAWIAVWRAMLEMKEDPA